MSEREHATAGTLDWIHRNIEVLSWPPERQLAYLRALGAEGLADELALQFNDTIPFVAQLAARSTLSPDAKRAADKIDEQLARMSENRPELWSENSLRSAPEWREVRALAQAALELFPPAGSDPGGPTRETEG